MRKFLGQVNFNLDEPIVIENKITQNKVIHVGEKFFLDFKVDSQDFYDFSFPELSTRIFIDGELHDYNFQNPVNNKSFINRVIKELSSGNMSVLDELNGSFNLIIYNYDDNKLQIINDRFSTRPLYYYIDRKKFIFSNRMSEVGKCLTKEKKINKEAVAEFFKLQMVLGDKTFIQEVSAFKVATVNTIYLGELLSKKYWHFNHQKLDEKFNEKDYINKLSDLMKRIIDFKTKENNKYGILLSGGVDSRAILAADKNKKISDVFTLGDSYNIECKIAKEIADKHDSNFNYIQRDINHYYNIIEESVEIGDGMHNYLNGHFIGYLNQINDRVDIVFNGSLIEQLWQGSKFIKKKIKVGRYHIKLPFFIKGNKDPLKTVIDNFPRKLKGIEKIFKTSMNLDYEKSLYKNFNELLLENFGDKEVGYQEAIDYLACDSYGRYSSHLNQLCINDKMKYRTIYDNRLIDLFLSVPIKYRSDGVLLKKAIKKLDNPLANIILANSRIKLKRVPYLHWLSTYCINGYYKIFKKKSYKSENSSWPNYAMLIIENTKIQEKILSIIEDKDLKNEEIFDHGYLMRLFNEHIHGEKNNERILFQLITFGVWYKKFWKESIELHHS